MVVDYDQIRFTCGKLGFSENRIRACEAIIVRETSAYSAEGIYTLPKGTASRDAIKCSIKWGELLEDAQAINDLLVKANEPITSSTGDK